jgi:hypothetical protein
MPLGTFNVVMLSLIASCPVSVEAACRGWPTAGRRNCLRRRSDRIESANVITLMAPVCRRRVTDLRTCLRVGARGIVAPGGGGAHTGGRSTCPTDTARHGASSPCGGRIVSFIGAGLLIILSVLGFVHARWIGPATEVLAAHLKKVNAHLKKVTA